MKMDQNHRRSSLRKSVAMDFSSVDVKTHIKRRISFSGKHLVREFHGEEEPKTWNNSYEISDHLNVDETGSNLAAPSKGNELRGPTREKEQVADVQQNHGLKNKTKSIANNISVFNTTRDLINGSYQNQNCKVCQIDNSVDITLYDGELKFQVEEKTFDSTINSCSFYLDGNEKELRSITGEKTADFMGELRNEDSNIREENSTKLDYEGKHGVSDYNDYMNKEQCGNFSITESNNKKESLTVYMSDCLLTSCSGELSGVNKNFSSNRKTIQQQIAMQISPVKIKQYDKENINPALSIINETQNKSCQMEIEDGIDSKLQQNVNIENHLQAFEKKLNRLSFLQQSNDNIEMDSSQRNHDKGTNLKFRPTINCNQSIEISPQKCHDNLNDNNMSNIKSCTIINFKETIENSLQSTEIDCHDKNVKSRPTIIFNQPIELSPEILPQSTYSDDVVNFKVQNMKSRPIITSNQSVELSPENKISGRNNVSLSKLKLRPTINYNQTIEIDSESTIISDEKLDSVSRTTVNVNRTLEISTHNDKNSLTRPSIYNSEDMQKSPVKLSQESVAGNNMNALENIHKPCQQPKLVVRKICTPLMNKSKKQKDLEQQRILRYKKKQEQNVQEETGKNEAIITTLKELPITEKSLNFSLNSLKNVSLSSDSSSPLIPSEFKAYNLKQLNDEIERGEIHIFSSAFKTPITDRKARITSHFHCKNGISAETSTKQRKTLVFKDMDILMSSYKTLINNNFQNAKSNYDTDFNPEQDITEEKKENNPKCRFSQADELMLDNTSFLTRAKLGDETVSRNSSNRTQPNDLDIFDESLGEEGSTTNSKICNKENYALSSMFQNAKPLFRQTGTNLKNFNNVVDLYNTTNMQNEVVNINIEEKLNKAEKNSRQILYTKRDSIVEKSTHHEIVIGNSLLENKENILEEKAMEEPFHNNHCTPIAKNFEITNKSKYLGDVTNLNNNKSKTTDQCKSKNINREADEVCRENLKRRTIFPNEDIADDIRHDGNTNSVLDQCSAKLSEQFSGRPQAITNFEDNNVAYENLVVPMEQCVTNRQTVNTENVQYQYTIIYDKEIDLEESMEKPIQVMEKTAAGAETEIPISNLTDINSKTVRKTLYFNRDIEEIRAEISNQTEFLVPKSRKSIYTVQSMDMTLDDMNAKKKECRNEIKLETISGLCSHDVKQTNLSINNLHLNTDDNNSKDVQNNKKCLSRKSIYANECMDLSLDSTHERGYDKGAENQTDCNAVSEKPLQIKETFDCVMDLTSNSIDPISINNDGTIYEEKKQIELPKGNTENNYNNANQEKINTLHLYNNTFFEQSFTRAENYEFPESKGILNAAKLNFTRQSNAVSILNSDKLRNILKKQDSALLTPVKTFNHRLFHMTPRLSLLEFTAAEKKTREEDSFDCNKDFTPIRTVNNTKRLPVNLTPVISIPKKRQTLVFDDCLMDESFKLIGNDMTQTKNVDKEARNEEKKEKQKTVFLSKNVLEMSGITSNVSVLQTTPRTIKSRIPILVSCNKQHNKSPALMDVSDVHNKELEVQNMEEDVLAESIQLMRRATTFVQNRDTNIEQSNNEADFVKNAKPSIFEGNPITISDVSVFFEDKKQSNTIDPKTKINIAPDHNSSCLKAAERKSMENRYINLTLEDIDKTRLSLVLVSYEDAEDGNTNANKPLSDQKNSFVEEISSEKIAAVNKLSVNDDGNNGNTRNKCQSLNYLRNISAVCRKCKRCQDTFLNETTSSSTESFVLPILPPLPDLGLDRLRRLRKRPAISDVNVLWQRVSLDRTLVNAINISDDDSQIMSDREDDSEDETSPVTKCFRKYEKDMQSFELELMGRKQISQSLEELPFVSRLNNILSTNSTNWIFDFQRQYRGILLFTHRKILTFSVLLIFDEVDSFGHEIHLKSVKLEKSDVSEKYWKPIDFALDFQLKLNLPFDLQSLCENNNEDGIFKMLQIIDNVCLDTIKMGNSLQRISFTNQASIIRDECRTYVRKIIRKIVKRTESDFEHVEKTEVKVELLNLKRMSFRNIATPPLHNFREEIHLLPIGLQFLHEFLPHPLNYLKHHEHV